MNARLPVAAGLTLVLVTGVAADPLLVPDLRAPRAAGIALDSLAAAQGTDAGSFRVDPPLLDLHWASAPLLPITRYVQAEPLRAPATLVAMASKAVSARESPVYLQRQEWLFEMIRELLQIPLRFPAGVGGGPSAESFESLLAWLFTWRGDRFTGQTRERILRDFDSLQASEKTTLSTALACVALAVWCRRGVVEESDFRTGGAFGSGWRSTRRDLAEYRALRLGGGSGVRSAMVEDAVAGFPTDLVVGVSREVYSYVSEVMGPSTEGSGFSYTWETPSGRIGIGGGGPNQYTGEFLLVVDFGGDDTYAGPGATDVTESGVSFVFDWGGNDTYAPADSAALGPGSAVLGFGGVMDYGEGNDRYQGGALGLGFGLLGAGWILDHGGDDRYLAGQAGEGFGWHGLGILVDIAGDDDYRFEPAPLEGGNSIARGQGFGGQRGLGLLVDFVGNDTYADRSSESRNLVRGSGAAISRLIATYATDLRSPAPDGVGGIGLLIDAAGDDTYQASANGMGSDGGLGVVLDLGGRDIWRGDLGRGDQGGVGIVVDLAGDDAFDGALGTGSTEGLGLFLDVQGSDTYSGSAGTARDQGMGAFFDLEGEDTYRVRDVGVAVGREGDVWSSAPTVGLYIDVHGPNRYALRTPRGRGLGGVFPSGGWSAGPQRGGAVYEVLEVVDPLGGKEPE
jgi:hypothetical protein